MKTCRHCGIAKVLTEFHAHPTKSDGRDHRCKPCAKAARAALRLRRLPEFRAREAQRKRESYQRFAH